MVSGLEEFLYNVWYALFPTTGKFIIQDINKKVMYAQVSSVSAYVRHFVDLLAYVCGDMFSIIWYIVLWRYTGLSPTTGSIYISLLSLPIGMLNTKYTL